MLTQLRVATLRDLAQPADANSFMEAWRAANHVDKSESDYKACTAVLRNAATHLAQKAVSASYTKVLLEPYIVLVTALSESSAIATSFKDTRLARNAKRFLAVVASLIDLNSAAAVLLTSRKEKSQELPVMLASLEAMRGAILVAEDYVTKWDSQKDDDFGPAFIHATKHTIALIQRKVMGYEGNVGYMRIQRDWALEIFNQKREAIVELRAVLNKTARGSPKGDGKDWTDIFLSADKDVESGLKDGYHKSLKKINGDEMKETMDKLSKAHWAQ
jgi:hypothetical protein